MYVALSFLVSASGALRVFSVSWGQCDVKVGMSALLLRHLSPVPDAGSRLGQGLNFPALVCGIFLSLLLKIFSRHSSFLPSAGIDFIRPPSDNDYSEYKCDFSWLRIKSLAVSLHHETELSCIFKLYAEYVWLGAFLCKYIHAYMCVCVRMSKVKCAHKCMFVFVCVCTLVYAYLIYRGFPTRMEYFYYISCLRYTILVGNPRMYYSRAADRLCLTISRWTVYFSGGDTGNCDGGPGVPVLHPAVHAGPHPSAGLHQQGVQCHVCP